ncbi:VaFE repeat-containing surface-anchored protein, partial [Myceligenerans crystallogenes]|uniref:VaFE repeat-containing surface-anchored protein n=1 Tax=Myceligenerans crystallogenes TaxID=316335 RepID=UPI0031D6AB64
MRTHRLIRRARGAAIAGTLGLVAMSGIAPAQAAITTYNPFDANAGFTIVSTGDAHLANGELEGSVAVFGTLSSDNVNGYPVIHQAAGMADYTVPVIDGDPVRILAGSFTGTGSFDLANRDDSGTISSSSPEANAIAKLTDTTGFTAQVRGGGVGNNAGGDFPRVTNTSGGFLDLKPLPYDTFTMSDIQTAQSSVAAYLPDLEAQVAQTNACLSSMYGNPQLSNAVTITAEGGLVYAEGFSTTMPNVIDYADVAGATIKMDRAGGYVPTAEAPLVIRVPAGTTTISRVNFEGWSSASSAEQDYARFILLDLSEVTGPVTVDGLEMGALWAPEADINFSSGITTNGQWLASGVTTSGGGEIHHHTFGGELLCDLAGPAPSITTSVAVAGSPDDVLPATGGTVTDTVSYSGLTAGAEYVVSGTVMAGDGTSTGVTAGTTFTPEASSGTVDVVFTFTADDAAAHAGDALVVFEELTLGGELVADHEDLTDPAQTFTVAELPLVPEIATSVAVAGTDDKVMPLTGGDLVDTVSYAGLTAGTEYVLSGTVMTSGGTSTGIVASRTFTPAESSGTVEVTFTLVADDVAAYAGQSLVVFEELGLADEVVAEHEDLTDPAQTFEVAERVSPSPTPTPSPSVSPSPSPSPSPSVSPSPSPSPSPSVSPSP